MRKKEERELDTCMMMMIICCVDSVREKMRYYGLYLSVTKIEGEI